MRINPSCPDCTDRFCRWHESEFLTTEIIDLRARHAWRQAMYEQNAAQELNTRAGEDSQNAHKRSAAIRLRDADFYASVALQRGL
jgi:hypothetical protein